jgi:ornithine carbamoyltransferase
MKSGRHFLDLNVLDSESLRSILTQASVFKESTRAQDVSLLEGRVLALVFERPSTRTRISFQVAMLQLGGQAVVLSLEDSQLGRGESMADTARVLSRYVDAIVIRAMKHKTLLELAEYAEVPVINGLSHPCQLMADIMTFEEHRGPISGRVITWSGDGNNVARSWIHAAIRFGFELRLACPVSLSPDAKLIEWAETEGGCVTLTHDAKVAAAGADCVVTDTWTSMGAEATKSRRQLLTPFKVDEALMSFAKPDALFMHCLPAHRDEEVASSVIDGENSVVWDGAGNRLHAQKGILSWCLT